MRRGFVSRGRIYVFQRRFASVLAGCVDVSEHNIHACEAVRTFAEEWEVDFCYFAVEAEYGLEVGFDDIPGEVRDNNHFCVGFVVASVVHLNVDIVQRVWRA